MQTVNHLPSNSHRGLRMKANCHESYISINFQNYKYHLFRKFQMGFIFKASVLLGAKRLG